MRLFIYIYQIKYILYSRHLQNIIILTIDLFSLPPGTREENVFQLSLGLPLNLTLLKCAKSYPSNKLPSNKWCCAHIHDPNISWLFAFWGVFNVFDKVISMCLGQLPKIYSYWKHSTLCDNWWGFEGNWTSKTPSASSYICKEVKIALVGNEV